MWRFRTLALGVLLTGTAALVAAGIQTATVDPDASLNRFERAIETPPERRRTWEVLDPFAEPRAVTIRGVRVTPCSSEPERRAEWAASGYRMPGSASSFDMLVALPLIDSALARYGEGALAGARLHIIVVARLFDADGPAVGWIDEREDTTWIWLSTREENGDLQPAVEIARTIHHELSSWVLTRVERQNLLERWCDELPAGFTYRGMEYVSDYWYGPDRYARLSEVVRRNGFARPYGMTSFDNDFNTIAEMVFCPDAEFERSVVESHHLRAKLRLMAEAYRRAGVAFPLRLPEPLTDDEW